MSDFSKIYKPLSGDYYGFEMHVEAYPPFVSEVHEDIEEYRIEMERDMNKIVKRAKKEIALLQINGHGEQCWEPGRHAAVDIRLNEGMVTATITFVRFEDAISLI